MRMYMAMIAGLGLASAPVLAAPVINGTIAGDSYGAAQAVQNTQTEFGDSNQGTADTANGSELDAAYAVVSGGNLYLALTGNLQTNYNKLDIFFDTVAGGQNRLLGNTGDSSFDRMGDDHTNGNGLTFDTSFSPDYALMVNAGGTPVTTYVNYYTLGTSSGSNLYLGSFAAGNGLANTVGTTPNAIIASLDNSNTAGVDAGSGAANTANAAAVQTGVELEIPLAMLGNPTGTIGISALINGSGNDFISNQVLGGIGGGANLGEPRSANFSTIAGNQYFTVAVPEPASIGLLVMCGIGALAARRRRRA